MPKIYRTMQGEQVDIEALFHRNELTQAVGNMRVNARGDELGRDGKVVKTKEQKIKEYYDRMNQPKRGPGRPRKNPEPDQVIVTEEPAAPLLDDLNDIDGDADLL
jgi:hypothetical protein